MIPIIRRAIVVGIVLGMTWWMNTYAVGEAENPWFIFAKHLLLALLVFGVVALFDMILRVFLWQGYFGKVLGARIPRLLPLVISVFLYGGAALNLLHHDYGVSLAGALAASGFLAIILGFALRSVILDLFSGIAVSIDRSYIVGDWITVTSRDFPHPVYGRVEDIDWRTTRLRLEDHTLFIMPNSLSGAFSINNHSQPRGPKRLSFTLTLPHETPSDRAIPLIMGATRKALVHDALTTDPAPTVLIDKITTDGVKYLIRFFADVHRINPSPAISIVQREVHQAIMLNGLQFAGEKVDLFDHRATSGDILTEHFANRADAVRRVFLFADVLTGDEMDELASTAKDCRFQAGRTFIRQGDEGDSVFVILSGAARVELTNDGSPPCHLATLSAGDLVGEMSLLTGKPRGASVIADTDVHAFEIARKDMAPLLERRPGIAEALSALLAERLSNQAASNDEEGADVAPAEPLRARILAGMRDFFSLKTPTAP